MGEGLGPSVWWANQGRTGSLERVAGVLWAPERGSVGQRVPSFETLTRMAVGDLVVHYERQRIVAVGRVRVPALQLPRPYEPDDRRGWLVTVDVDELDLYLPLEVISLPARRAVTGGVSAFDKNGDVRNGYVFEVVGAARAEVLDRVVVDVVPAAASEAVGRRLVVGETDRNRLGSYRVEQPELRRIVVGTGPTAVCVFCGRRLPGRFIVTAHIKRRAACSFGERTDSDVAVPACTLGCDALFEFGVIHVDRDGSVHATTTDVPTDLAASAQVLDGRTVVGYRAGNAVYFAWHRRFWSTCRGAR